MENKLTEGVCKDAVFKQVFEKHAKSLHDFLYYKYGEENNPQDLVQEAFMKLWDNCSKVTITSARSFLFTVGNNLMLNQLSRKKTVLTYAKEEDPQLSTEESPEYVMEEKEYMTRLQNALAELTEDQRVTFMLNRVEGKKHKEIAEILGISAKAVEKRIYTTLSILKSKLGNIS